MKQLYLVTILLITLLSKAQSTQFIKAKVVDVFNQPIAEVNIKDLTSESGTVTDTNGNFEIQIADINSSVLKFSHIAYKTVSYNAIELSNISVITLQNTEGQLDDVIIAKRKIDNPTEVISILSENFMNQNQIASFQQTADFVPGLEVYEQNPNQPNYAIRGITDETTTPSATSRVSVFVEGLLKSKPAGSLRSIFDVASIEVTKGPQVAKYGKVTQVGGLNLIQKKAQEYTSGKLTSGGGNFDEKYINGYFNTPIVKDKLFFRVSGLHQFRKGYIKNTGSGEDFNSINTFAVRTAFKYKFSSNTTIDVIANYQEDSPQGVGFKSLVIPQRDGNLNRFTGVALERGDDLGTEKYQRNITALLNHQWGKWSLQGNIGYEKFRANDFIDIDGSLATSAVINDISIGEVASTGWNLKYVGNKISSKIGFNLQSDYSRQELSLDVDEQNIFVILSNPKNAVINGQPTRVENFLSIMQLSGLLFVLEQNGTISTQEAIQLTPLVPLLGGSPLLTSVIDTQTNGSQNYSSDIYGNFAYKITNKLKTDLAFRITHDYIEGALFVPQTSTLGRPLGLLTGSFPNNISFPSGGEKTIHENFLSVTGSVALDYKLSNDVNIFTSVARGRRPQGINYFNNDFRIIKDETVWNYELGFKSFLFNNTLSFNSSAYILKFTNFSTPVADNANNQMGQINFNVDDTGKATSLGFEFDFNYFLNDKTTIFGNYNYIDATIDDEDVDGNRSQYAGNKIRLTPKHAFTVGCNWQKEFAKEWDIYVRPNFTFKSDVYFTADNKEELSQSSYGLLNFRTGVILKNNYELSFFMSNVLDRNYINDAGNTGNQFAIPTTISGMPRVFGGRLTASF